MKKLVLVICLGLVVGFSYAQQNAIKVNFISPAVKTASFFYERVLNDEMSVQLGVYYMGWSFGDTKLRGLGFTPEFRYYLSSDEAPAGFYLGPFARYASYTVSEDYSSYDINMNPITVHAKGTLTNIGGGCVIGRQWVFKETITLDSYFGPYYLSSNLKVTEGSATYLDTGFMGGGFTFRFGATVGFAF